MTPIHPCLAKPLCSVAGDKLRGPACDFEEAAVWDALGGGWQCLHGCYCKNGLSIEWHDFSCSKPQDWARTFHPGSLEVCCNLSGRARLACDQGSLLVGPMSIVFYHAVGEKLSAWRLPADRHQFLTLEFSHEFLTRHLAGHEASLHPLIRRILAGQREGPCASVPMALTSTLRKKIAALQDPPVKAAAAPVYYQGQALAMMADLFFQTEPPVPAPSRQQALARQRVEKAIEILGQRLANPPTLEELGREVGCSQFYLSRTFSRQMSMTIPQYLRQIRMERAAELLKSGRFNVTEAALEVGYSSISHFSHAFYETMGCCPGLYPLGVIMPGGKNTPTPVQAADKK